MTIAEVCSVTKALKGAGPSILWQQAPAESQLSWLQAQFPILNLSQLSTIQSLYPPPPPATHQANTGAPPLQPTTTFATSAQASTQTTWPPISTLRHPLIQKIVPRSTSLLGIISWETISREGARITSVKNRQFQVEATQPPSLRGLRAGQPPFFY